MDKSSSDPNQLTGEDSREEGTLKPRDFFWDSAVLYLVSVILALSVVDALTEYIKGSSVACNVREENNVSPEYINNFCAESLPITEYLPAFIFIHGLAISIPHFLWLANFSGQFDYFFSVVSTFDRSRDETTGRYSERNINLVRQLQLAFTTYGRNFIYYLYLGKLGLQLIFSLASLVVSVIYFTDFDVIFNCPRNNVTTADPYWPLDGQVTCIFTSLKLLFWIRIGDMFLICLILLSVLWGMVWALGGHPTELGAKDVARFTFQSGIQSEYYVAPFSQVAFCQKCLATVCFSFPWRFRSPGILTDLDFMLVKLYRTNAGLGRVFKEIQIDLVMQSMMDSEQEILTLHNNKQNNKIPLKISEDKIDILWTFAIKDGNPFSSFKTVNSSQCIQVPNSVRGAILGLSAFAPNNKGALSISFGQSGLGEALARVFQRVGSVQFTKFKMTKLDKEKPAESAKDIIDLQVYLNSFVTVTLPENILALSLNYDIELLSSIESIWDIVMKRGQREIRRTKKTSFLVVGPMDREEQGVTVTLFLQQIQDRLEDGCILLTLTPVKISGKKTDFVKWTPPECFQSQLLIVTTTPSALPWPPKPRPVQRGGSKDTVLSSSTHETIEMESLGTMKQESPLVIKPLQATDTSEGQKKKFVQSVKLTTGSDVMVTKFEIAAFVYNPVESDEGTRSIETATIKPEAEKLPKTSNEEQAKENKQLLLTAEVHLQ